MPVEVPIQFIISCRSRPLSLSTSRAGHTTGPRAPSSRGMGRWRLSCWRALSSSAARRTATRLCGHAGWKGAEKQAKAAQERRAEAAGVEEGEAAAEEAAPENTMPALLAAAQDTQSNGYLSNWATSPFELDGVRYASAEQWIMASKARACGDEATLGAIMQSRSPRKQKALGRSLDPKKVSRFWTLQAKWEAQLRGARGKFQQNEALALRLLKTGQKPIAEASPSDRIFGIGLAPNDPLAQDTANWKRGHNLLGKALAQVRDELRASVLAQPPDFQGDLQLLLATAEPPAPPEANPAAGQLVQEEDLLSDPGSDGGVEEPSESESEPPGGGDLT
uniref:NADAR domain-containing protein n=1 Tax=Alexandrium monilatum TaxID=311494 RepID=A0A7S4UDK8_9DINO|mmetsp:Transcript_11361/g.34229  ORF Transcript_11361/g.34229 Transcript_11361/m.34229 type:complete len:335 (-) Transcript_11361:133-1137(-)